MRNFQMVPDEHQMSEALKRRHCFTAETLQQHLEREEHEIRRAGRPLVDKEWRMRDASNAMHFHGSDYGASRLMGLNGSGFSFFSLLVAEFVVPVCPPSSVSQNARVHWSTRNAATQDFLKAAWAVALEARPVDRLHGMVLACGHIGWAPRRKIMDASNAAASLKAMVDGMTHAGWWDDDKEVQVLVNSQRLWKELSQEERDDYPGGFVRVRVYVPEAT